jgi:hypothetical protein
MDARIWRKSPQGGRLRPPRGDASGCVARRIYHPRRAASAFSERPPCDHPGGAGKTFLLRACARPQAASTSRWRKRPTASRCTGSGHSTVRTRRSSSPHVSELQWGAGSPAGAPAHGRWRDGHPDPLRPAHPVMVTSPDEDIRHAFRHREKVRYESYRRLIHAIMQHRGIKLGLDERTATDLLFALLTPNRNFRVSEFLAAYSIRHCACGTEPCRSSAARQRSGAHRGALVMIRSRLMAWLSSARMRSRDRPSSVDSAARVAGVVVNTRRVRIVRRRSSKLPSNSLISVAISDTSGGVAMPVKGMLVACFHACCRSGGTGPKLARNWSKSPTRVASRC